MRSLALFLLALAACTSESTPRTFDGFWKTDITIFECASMGTEPLYSITVTFAIADDSIEILDTEDENSAGTITVDRDGDTILIAGDVPLGAAGTLVGVNAMLTRDRNVAAAADGSSVDAYSFDAAMADCRLAMTLTRK